MGAWISYGIGSETEDLPAFVVMISPGQGRQRQPLYDRLWGSGFLPSRYQGVKFRSVGDPVLYLSNPSGFDAENRRRFLDAAGELNRMAFEEFGDPETNTRISQYEMAFRMQTLGAGADRSFERAGTARSSCMGEDARKPGTFAANCLLARRLAERGVRFIQLYHRDWDHHGKLPQRSAEALQGDRSAVGGADRPISSSAGCWTTRWWSGAGNSGGRFIARAA